MEKMRGTRCMALRKRNKKGSIQDIVFIIAAIAVFGLATLFGFKISNEFNTEIQGNADIPTEAKDATTSLVAHYPGIMDNIFLLATFGMAMTALVLAALVRVHPIFIPLFIIALITVVFASGAVSNIYQEFAATTQLSTEADQLTFISHILEWLPLLVAVLGSLMMVVLYKIGGQAEL